MSAKILEFALLQMRREAEQYAFDHIFYGIEAANLRYCKKITPAFRKLIAVEYRKYGFPETGPG